MKTPEELAEEYAIELFRRDSLSKRYRLVWEYIDSNGERMANERDFETISEAEEYRNSMLNEGDVLHFSVAIRDGCKQYIKSSAPHFLAGYQAAKDQFADTSKVMNSPEKQDSCDHILDMGKMVDVNFSNNSNGWISVKDRLPGSKDGVTQLWMKGCSLADLVLGCHAVMTDKGETVEGVLDMNKPDGIWDLSDFTHWMPLPKPPTEE
jgi:hypothetical protein